jgi:hypothetical protein
VETSHRDRTSGADGRSGRLVRHRHAEGDADDGDKNQDCKQWMPDRARTPPGAAWRHRRG